MDKNPADTDLLIETSWEVCNKVGGIYTVLSTKAHNLQKLYHDRAIFIGPDVWTAEHQSPFFKESKTLVATRRRKYPCRTLGSSRTAHSHTCTL